MSGYVVIGTQWEDEGEDRIVNYLGSCMDAAVRLQGGNNAGHTAAIQDKHTRQNQQAVPHLLPSDVLRKVSYIIGPGVVADPFASLGEINQLEERGFNIDHVLLSDRSYIIMPYHVQLDALTKASLKDHKIGIAKRGTGPYYANEYSRQGLRIRDLQDSESFKKELKLAVDMKNITFQKVYEDPGFSYEELVAQFAQIHKVLLPCIINAQIVTNQALGAQKQILFEGAQAATLDVNYRDRPHMTSSSPTSAGVCISAGVSPKKLDTIIDITEAYSTRVGEGPFVNELFDDMGTQLREQGHEFGATAGRPRRCGWLDMNVVRHAAMVNGSNDPVITKLDVLDGLKKICMCVACDIGGVCYDYIPSSMEELQRAEPTYKEFDGWQEDVSMMRAYEEPSENCKIYLRRAEELCNTRISMVSVSPERNCNVYLHGVLEQSTIIHHFCNIVLLSE